MTNSTLPRLNPMPKYGYTHKTKCVDGKTIHEIYIHQFGWEMEHNCLEDYIEETICDFLWSSSGYTREEVAQAIDIFRTHPEYHDWHEQWLNEDACIRSAIEDIIWYFDNEPHKFIDLD